MGGVSAISLLELLTIWNKLRKCCHHTLMFEKILISYPCAWESMDIILLCLRKYWYHTLVFEKVLISYPYVWESIDIIPLCFRKYWYHTLVLEKVWISYPCVLESIDIIPLCLRCTIQVLFTDCLIFISSIMSSSSAAELLPNNCVSVFTWER